MFARCAIVAPRHAYAARLAYCLQLYATLLSFSGFARYFSLKYAADDAAIFV